MTRQPLTEESTAVLRDGSTVQIRRAARDDAPALATFYSSLSMESRVFRFFAAGADYESLARSLVEQSRIGLVAVTGADRHIVGHAMCATSGAGRVEVAFAIADDLQGHGLGTVLLGQLAEAAWLDGVEVLEAVVMPGNQKMLQVFRDSGYQVVMQAGGGEVKVEMSARPDREVLESFERRERRSTVASMAALLAPRSIAVVGASRRRGSPGGEIYWNLVKGGFQGPVYPVNAAAGFVHSTPAYPDILAVPGPVDMAVIAVPAAGVLEVAEQCAAKGVRSMVVISAGFGERGPEGMERQRKLLEICRGAGIRLVGPNCMGIINTAPEVSMNATFAPDPPPPGRVGFLSQSGGLGLAVISQAESLGLGLSSFISVGNKPDVSGNDLLQYWEEDPGTDVVLLYLESFGNPIKFARLARRLGRTKPVVAVKSGRTTAGTRGASSHTGALLAASDITVDALFKQSGVIRTDTLDELFDVASLLAHQPLPLGDRVGIITNAGGPGILCADACEGHGLLVPDLGPALEKTLAPHLVPDASIRNPIDMLAAAGREEYARAIRAVAESGEVDSVIVVFTPPLLVSAEEVAAGISEGAASLPPGMPVLCVFLSTRGLRSLPQNGSSIPSFAFPENAAKALGLVARYARWRATPDSTAPDLTGVDEQAASTVLGTALARGAGWLRPEEVTSVLSAYGLHQPEVRFVRSAEGAAHAAGAMGVEVAVKAAGPAVLHKSDLGAVELGLKGSVAVRRAARRMSRSLASKGIEVTGFEVQAMAPAGVEMLVGVVHDPLFGPVVACGAGGVTAELMKDVQVRMPPIGIEDAREMISALRTAPLLEGYRGAPRADRAALEDAVLRIGALVEAHPEIAELDLNPVLVGPEGAVVVDARIRVEAPAPRRPFASR